MTEAKHYTGGCLCGAVRYKAMGEPIYSGFCYCSDCRKASGSGFVAFMGFPASALRITGETRTFVTKAFKGGEALRNSCSICGSLVFGGKVGKAEAHTIYAGSLDDPSGFHPTVAIFTRNRAPWAALPPELIAFDEMPY